MKFTLSPYCNAYLPKDEKRVDVVVKIKAEPDGSETSARKRLVYGIILDVSGSMADHGKIAAAKLAVRGNIARIPDGATFFVVTFSASAKVVVRAAAASAETRAAADRVVARLDTESATSMCQGLAAADQEFGDDRDAVRVATLFTDGENGDDDRELKRLLGRLKGRFQCECRGIGDGWVPTQLLKIAEAMLGTAKGVGSGENMAADLKETLSMAASRGATDVKIRLVVPPKMARVVSVQQASPTLVDLPPIKVDDRTTDFLTAPWGADERDFHVVLEMNSAGAVGEQLRVARTAVVVGDAVLDQPAITVTWSEDTAQTALINPLVAHYTGQAELAEATREGFEALSRGDVQAATVKLGRAVQLAESSGNDAATKRLSKVVDVVDADRGTVRLRASVAKEDLLEAEVGATRTVRRAPPKN